MWRRHRGSRKSDVPAAAPRRDDVDARGGDLYVVVRVGKARMRRVGISGGNRDDLLVTGRIFDRQVAVVPSRGDKQRGPATSAVPGRANSLSERDRIRAADAHRDHLRIPLIRPGDAVGHVCRRSGPITSAERPAHDQGRVERDTGNADAIVCDCRDGSRDMGAVVVLVGTFALRQATVVACCAVDHLSAKVLVGNVDARVDDSNRHAAIARKGVEPGGVPARVSGDRLKRAHPTEQGIVRHGRDSKRQIGLGVDDARAFVEAPRDIGGIAAYPDDLGALTAHPPDRGEQAEPVRDRVAVKQ
jgi:hypothetical protein